MKLSKAIQYLCFMLLFGCINLFGIQTAFAADTDPTMETEMNANTNDINMTQMPVNDLQTPVALADANTDVLYGSNLISALSGNFMQRSLVTNRALFTNPSFASFENNNPPIRNSATYVDLPLGTSMTANSVTVQLNSGSAISDTTLTLSSMTTAELQKLSASSFTFTSNSPLKSSDVTLSYNTSQRKLTFTFNNATALMKANGPGTLAILNVASPTNSNSNTQINVGIWRNYITFPANSITLNDQFDLYYMINNAKNDLDSTVQENPTLKAATPNFYLYDKVNKKKVYALYMGNKIADNAYYADLFAGTNSIPSFTQQGRMTPVDHIYIRKDPSNPKRLLAQYDSYPISSTQMRYRMFLVIEPSANSDSVNVIQKAINYNPDGSTQRLWFYRKYNTALDGVSNVPVYYGSQVSSGINAGKPRGYYISNYLQNQNSPYRMTFDFSGNNGPTGFYAAKRGAEPFNSTTDPGQNVLGHAPDTVAASEVDTEISMLWSPAAVGSMSYGQASNDIGFNVGYDYSLAPSLRMDQDKVNYNPGTEATLPPLNLSGQVQDYDSSQVKVYYTIDDPVTPANATQNVNRRLSTVSLSAANNSNANWVKFPGGQATPTAAAITNQTDLNKLANGVAGHTIYVYAFDNGATGKPANLVSNIARIDVPALSSVLLQYRDQDGNVLREDQTIRGSVGSTYDTGDLNLFPREILKDNMQYTLNSIPSGATGVINGNQIITLQYTKLEGTLGITAPEKLDFGSNQIVPGVNTANIKSQDKPVEVTDTTGNPIWSLYMDTTPFTQSSSAQVMDGIMKYRTIDNTLLNITTVPQKILSYGDVNSAIVDNISTTNLDDFWWQESDGDRLQIGGPILQGDKDQLKGGSYQATITWTLQNSLDN